MQPVVFLAVLALAFAQQYPSCPGGSPISVGNSTDSYNQHIIELSTFLILGDSELELAFEHYLSTGDDGQVTDIITKNKNFYIIVTVVLVAVSLVLFVLLARMGDLKFSQREQFEKLKENGYSSPLSAFFSLIAVALLVFTGFAAYLIPSMMSSIKMTECRLDSLNQAFLQGSPQYNWDGIAIFLQKLALGSSLASSLKTAMANESFTFLTNTTSFAGIYINEGFSLYNGVKDDYAAAQVIFNDQNTSQNIALATLIPNLFASDSTPTNYYVFAELDALFSTLTSASNIYNKFEQILNESYSVLNQTATLFSQTSQTLTLLRNSFTQSFINFRVRIAPYFSSAQFSLIVSELLVGVTIMGCLVSLVTIRLIQAKFDFFSLRVYKIIWGSHIVVFCLNLATMLVTSQMLIYAEGACSMAEKVINNQTLLAELLPAVNNQTGEALFASCMPANSDFTTISHTAEQFRQINAFLQTKEEILSDYGFSKVANFHQVFDNLRLNLTAYLTGVSGTYPYLNQELSKMNSILLNNTYAENCFKHQWQYHPSACSATDNIVVLPKQPFPVDRSLTAGSFSSSPAGCFILSSYDSYYPHFINVSEFITLYGRFAGKCNASFTALKPLIVQFFGAEASKEAAISSLLEDTLSVEPYLRNASYYLAQYMSQRSSFINSLFKRLNSSTTWELMAKGNNCEVIGAMVRGVYNQFCINFRAQGREVYLIVLCNLAYSILLILLSFLYALELQTLNEGEDGDGTDRIQFGKTSSVIIESDASLADLESKSSSSKSDGHK